MEKTTLIPLFLEADTKEKLILLMLDNNIQNGKHYKYFSPIKDGKKWVVWYYGDVENTIMTKGIRKINDNKGN